MRFLLTADEFGADEARRIGLVQESFRLAATSSGQCRSRAASPTRRRSRSRLPSPTRTPREQPPEHGAIAHLRSVLPSILASRDAGEGLASFVDRRPGRFTGS